MDRARTTVLKVKAIRLWTVPIRRRGLEVNSMSAVCAAVPMTTEKWRKSQ